MKKNEKWTPERLEQWKKIRSGGKKRFIWTHGVLQWGGFMFFFSFAVFQHRHYGHVLSTEGNLPFRLIIALTVWTFVGYLYGRSRWLRSEQEYQDQKTGN
jgi:hypothetical protein